MGELVDEAQRSERAAKRVESTGVTYCVVGSVRCEWETVRWVRLGGDAASSLS